MHNPVGWFEIYVKDMARAKQFYAEVFGSEFTPLPGDGYEIQAFPMTPNAYGVSGALVHMPGFEAGHNSVLVYFICDDCAVEAGRAQAAGGRLFKPKTSIGQYGYIALIVDTEGNMIGLHSMA